MGYITLSNVSYTYPTLKEPVIKDINLSLEKGKLYALVGKNGSGKTTLCNIIRGFIPHFYHGKLVGDVIVNNQNIEDGNIGTLAPTVGYIFENPFNQMSGIKEIIYEELAYGLENLGVPRDEMIKRVKKIIELVGLEDLKDKHPMELSGGQQQRVAFASILIMETDIILIDEPTSQLDPRATESVFEIILHMKNEGKTIILVEHIMDLIAEFADEVIIMADGEIKLHDKTKKVLTDWRLASCGIPYTAYTTLGTQLMVEGLYQGELPTTIQEATNMIKGIIK